MAVEYRAFAKLFIAYGSGDDGATYGSGLVALLRGVRDAGSLNRAAKEMHMAYSKAWKLMNSAEAHFETQLIIRDGARGSKLTEEGERLVTAFDAVSAELSDYATRRLQEELAKL